VTKEVTSRHQRNRLRTRGQIQSAIYQLLQEKSYTEMSIQDIVDQADVGRGTFYLHFKDKDEAVWSLIEKGLKETDFLAHQAFEQDPSTVTFEKAIQNIFHHVEQNKRFYEIMLGDKGNAAIALRVQDWLAKDIEKEASILNIPALITGVPLPVAAQYMSGAITRLAIWWLMTPNQYGAVEMAEFTYRTFTYGVHWQ